MPIAAQKTPFFLSFLRFLVKFICMYSEIPNSLRDCCCCLSIFFSLDAKWFHFYPNFYHRIELFLHRIVLFFAWNQIYVAKYFVVLQINGDSACECYNAILPLCPLSLFLAALWMYIRNLHNFELNQQCRTTLFVLTRFLSLSLAVCFCLPLCTQCCIQSLRFISLSLSQQTICLSMLRLPQLQYDDRTTIKQINLTIFITHTTTTT